MESALCEHRWKIKIAECDIDGQGIGIGIMSVNEKKFYIYHNTGWVTSETTAPYSALGSLVKYGKGDEVSVSLDTADNTVSFAVNDTKWCKDLNLAMAHEYRLVVLTADNNFAKIIEHYIDDN